MPVPGPRTQYGPVPGYRNLSLHAEGGAGETYRRAPASAVGTEIPGIKFNRWHRPAPVAEMGRTPGVQWLNRRGNVLGAGQIRRFWKQAVNYIPAPAPYSWTSSAPNPREPGFHYPAMPPITRALRYMTRSIATKAGTDNTRFEGLHTKILPSVRSMPVTRGAGGKNRPTVRNRISSFGSRVPTLNHPVDASSSQP